MTPNCGQSVHPRMGMPSRVILVGCRKRVSRNQRHAQGLRTKSIAQFRRKSLKPHRLRRNFLEKVLNPWLMKCCIMPLHVPESNQCLQDVEHSADEELMIKAGR